MGVSTLDAAQAILTAFDTSMSKHWREEDRRWRIEDRQWRGEDMAYREEERQRLMEEAEMRELERECVLGIVIVILPCAALLLQCGARPVRNLIVACRDCECGGTYCYFQVELFCLYHAQHDAFDEYTQAPTTPSVILGLRSVELALLQVENLLWSIASPLASFSV